MAAKRTGVLRCPTNKHRMVKVSDALWLCECYATGDATRTPGAEATARYLIARRGGWPALRDEQKQRAADAFARRQQKRAQSRFA